MLAEAGYRQRRDTRELVMVDPDNDIEFFFLRPRDIAVYVGQGTLDVGITGRDLLLDAEVEAEELLPLGFAASTFRFAGPVGDFTSVAELEGKRLATSYDGLLRGYLAERGINAKVVRLDGAVESSVRLGVADAIADVVETGTTLKAAGMEIFGEPILNSESVLIAAARREQNPATEVLIRRLQGVLVARQYVMMDYDIRKELVGAGRRDSPRAWNRPPSLRCAIRTGWPSAPWCPSGKPTGSWTSSTTSAPAPSWSAASTPAASERATAAEFHQQIPPSSKYQESHDCCRARHPVPRRRCRPRGQGHQLRGPPRRRGPGGTGAPLRQQRRRRADLP